MYRLIVSAFFCLLFSTPHVQAEKIGVMGSTFDPITIGHEDIIERAAQLVDKLVLGVASSTRKHPFFPLKQRLAMVKKIANKVSKKVGKPIEVEPYDALMIEFAREKGATIVVRGLRSAADFEFEAQMASVNERLYPDIEGVFLMTRDNKKFISSSFVREIGLLGGDITFFIPKEILVDVKQGLSSK